MKLFSFPIASLEKAINKRILTLSEEHKEWFLNRWQQKPYKKSLKDAGVIFNELDADDEDNFNFMQYYGVRSLPTTFIYDTDVNTQEPVAIIIGNKVEEVKKKIKEFE